MTLRTGLAALAFVLGRVGFSLAAQTITSPGCRPSRTPRPPAISAT